MTNGIGALGRLFSQDKIIENRALNRLGAQALRAVIAHGLYRARPVRVPSFVATEVSELLENGVILMHDFLPAEHFAKVRAECSWLRGQTDRLQTRRDGWAVWQGVPIRTVPLERMTATHEFFRDPRLRAILTAAEQRPLGPVADHADFETMTYDDSTEVDRQTQLHSDCFFNTHKAWLYLDEVKDGDGPHVYVKGSHRLTLKRLEFIYRDSFGEDYPEKSPSRRITPEEMTRLGVTETVVTCPSNTLMIVNTCGYHRRLRGEHGRKRSGLSFFFRANPFAPHALHSAVARHPRLYGWLRGGAGALAEAAR
jgi:hypothetical protein